MTAHARVDDVEVAAGPTTLVFSFATTLQHELLHSASAARSLPTVLGRALAVKRMVDAELWRGSLPSIALNQLAATADRMQQAPQNATAELAALGGRLSDVVRLHTGGGNRSAAGGPPLPTHNLQLLIAAWMQPL